MTVLRLNHHSAAAKKKKTTDTRPVFWLRSEQQSYFWKRLRGDVLHALLVTHRTAAAQQDSGQPNRSRMKMKVMKKSGGVKQNGSMAYRQEGTYWSRQGGHSGSSVHGARKILEGETKTKKKKYRQHANNRHWETWDMMGWIRGWHCRAGSEAKKRINRLEGFKCSAVWKRSCRAKSVE